MTLYSWMNKPRNAAVGSRYRVSMSRLRIERWMRPFVSLLTDGEVSDSAKFGPGLWFVATHLASFVSLHRFFHICNLPSTHRAMLGPFLVALAFFVFLPVFGFSSISTRALPVLVFIATKSPAANRVSRDEWARFRCRVCPITFQFVYNALGCFAEHDVAVFLKKFRPDRERDSKVVGMVVCHATPRGAVNSFFQSSTVEQLRRCVVGGGDVQDQPPPQHPQSVSELQDGVRPEHSSPPNIHLRSFCLGCLQSRA